MVAFVEFFILWMLPLYVRYLLPLGGIGAVTLVGVFLLFLLLGVFWYVGSEHRLVGASLVMVMILLQGMLFVTDSGRLDMVLMYVPMLVMSLLFIKKVDFLRLEIIKDKKVGWGLAFWGLLSLVVGYVCVYLGDVSESIGENWDFIFLLVPVIVVVEELFWRGYLQPFSRSESEQMYTMVWGVSMAGLLAMSGGIGFLLGVVGIQVSLFVLFRLFRSLPLNFLVHLLFLYGLLFVVMMKG